MNVSGTIAALAVLGALVALAAAVYQADRLTNPPDYVHPLPEGFRYRDDPATLFGLAFRDVVVGSEGAAMRGWLIEAADKRVALIGVHGRGSDRTTFLPLVPALIASGISVLTIDLRENGTSDGSGRGTGLAVREADDVRNATAFLKALGYQTVIAAGCSLGASASLIAAATDRSIDAVVADSPLASLHQYVADSLARKLRGIAPLALTRLWGRLVVSIARYRKGLPPIRAAVDVVEDIAPRPILLVHGTRDGAVAQAHAKALFARAGAGKSLWLVEGAGHCEAMRTEPGTYIARVLDLARLAGGAPSVGVGSGATGRRSGT